jgi:hypothetical protein
MEKATVETIDNASIITIELSGAFYSDLQYVLTHLSQQKSEEEITALINKINSDDPNAVYEEWEIAVRVMLILCAEIEAKAKQQNAIKNVEVELQPVETTTAPPTNI